MCLKCVYSYQKSTITITTIIVIIITTIICIYIYTRIYFLKKINKFIYLYMYMMMVVAATMIAIIPSYFHIYI